MTEAETNRWIDNFFLGLKTDRPRKYFVLTAVILTAYLGCESTARTQKQIPANKKTGDALAQTDKTSESLKRAQDAEIDAKKKKEDVDRRLLSFKKTTNPLANQEYTDEFGFKHPAEVTFEHRIFTRFLQHRAKESCLLASIVRTGNWPRITLRSFYQSEHLLSHDSFTIKIGDQAQDFTGRKTPIVDLKDVSRIYGKPYLAPRWESVSLEEGRAKELVAFLATAKPGEEIIVRLNGRSSVDFKLKPRFQKAIAETYELYLAMNPIQKDPD